MRASLLLIIFFSRIMKIIVILLSSCLFLFWGCTYDINEDIPPQYVEYINETSHSLTLSVSQYSQDEGGWVIRPLFALEIPAYASARCGTAMTRFASCSIVFDDEKRLDYHLDIDDSYTGYNTNTYITDLASPLSKFAYEIVVNETSHTHIFRITNELYQQAK